MVPEIVPVRFTWSNLSHNLIRSFLTFTRNFSHQQGDVRIFSCGASKEETVKINDAYFPISRPTCNKYLSTWWSVDRTKNTCGKWQPLPQVALHPTFHAFLSRKTVTCVACDVPMSHVTLMTLTLPLCQDFRPDLLSVEYKLNCSWGLSLHSAAVSLYQLLEVECVLIWGFKISCLIHRSNGS